MGLGRATIRYTRDFFDRFFVWNHCPLLFIGHDRNLTPVALDASESRALDAVCDHALDPVIDALEPIAIVGIGRYAEQRVRSVVAGRATVGHLPHPSPASPAANRDWTALAEHALEAWLPG